jgi:hypothetical protein
VREFSFEVRRVEYLGADRHLYGAVAEGEAIGGSVIAKLSSSVAEPVREGDGQAFAVPERALYVFDAATGKRWRA